MMGNKKHILFFTTISPFPTNGGERIRSYGLLKALSELKYEISAIITNQDNVDLKHYALLNVTYYPLQLKNPSKINKLLGLYYFNQDKKIISLFNKVQLEKPIDIAFIDYGFLGQYIKYFKDKSIKVIYGTHNAQAFLSKQRPTNSFFKYIKKRLRIYIQQFHERYYFNKANKLIVVSQFDYEYHSKFVNESKIVIIPNFLDESLYFPEVNCEKDNYFIMTANFTAYMNYFGLKWFLYNIWDLQISSQAQLLLVGKGSKEALSMLGDFHNVEALGMVENVKPYIAKAKATIVPLLHGSGSRLKVLESMALGVNIISTTKGVEGIISNDFYIADTVDEFKKVLINHIFQPSEYNYSLQNTFLKMYSLSSMKSIIKNVIES